MPIFNGMDLSPLFAPGQWSGLKSAGMALGKTAKRLAGFGDPAQPQQDPQQPQMGQSDVAAPAMKQGLSPAEFSGLGLPPQNTGSLGETGVKALQAIPMRGTPPKGTARTWSSGPTGETHGIEETGLPVGQQPNHLPQPAPIGAAWSGFGRGGHAGGMVGGEGGGTANWGSMAARPIQDFYSSIGMPLDEVIGQAQQDEQIGRQAFGQNQANQEIDQRLKQMGMVHQMSQAPQMEALEGMKMMSDPGFKASMTTWDPTTKQPITDPRYQQLMNHYMQQLLPQTQTGTTPPPTQPSGAATNQVPEAPHPGFGGAIHAMLHSALPALGAGLSTSLIPAEVASGPWGWPLAAATAMGSYYGLNKAADAVDPGGVEAAHQHQGASLTGSVLGGGLGYKGSKAMRRSGTPAPAESQTTPTSQTPQTLGSEYDTPLKLGWEYETPSNGHQAAQSAMQDFANKLGVQANDPRLKALYQRYVSQPEP